MGCETAGPLHPGTPTSRLDPGTDGSDLALLVVVGGTVVVAGAGGAGAVVVGVVASLFTGVAGAGAVVGVVPVLAASPRWPGVGPEQAAIAKAAAGTSAMRDFRVGVMHNNVPVYDR